jgi:cytochrome P450
MALVGPAPLEPANPLLALRRDLVEERTSPIPFPPGETRFSIERTKRFAYDPLPLLLEGYERYGPVFTMRVFHSNVVFMLGPAANHYITVSHAENFTWRESHYRELIPFLGDGLLTIDGEFHRRSRQIMLPPFHHENIASCIDIMAEETDRALEQVVPERTIDLYLWTRALALRIAMRALFGLDPDGNRARSVDAAELFEQALSYYTTPYPLRMLRGPFTPWQRLQRTSQEIDRLVYEEISRRRATGERGQDVLSLLLDAEDDDGSSLSDIHVRDEVMTLLFAGHDTTTSTVSFMFHELARQPDIAERLVAEQEAKLAGGRPDAELLMGGELQELEMVLDETLRMYPAAWVGPRRAEASFEFEGHQIPARAYVNYSSWASHHLPDVFTEPSVFRPSRFAPEAKAALPKGAYIPFGGGSRTCIGMRFGQLEVRTIATMILHRFRLEQPERFELTIRQMPTISPKQGLPVIAHTR